MFHIQKNAQDGLAQLLTEMKFLVTQKVIRGFFTPNAITDLGECNTGQMSDW